MFVPLTVEIGISNHMLTVHVFNDRKAGPTVVFTVPLLLPRNGPVYTHAGWQAHRLGTGQGPAANWPRRRNIRVQVWPLLLLSVSAWPLASVPPGSRRRSSGASPESA